MTECPICGRYGCGSSNHVAEQTELIDLPPLSPSELAAALRSYDYSVLDEAADIIDALADRVRELENEASKYRAFCQSGNNR